MKKKELQKIEKLINEFESIKKKIQTERDKLREVFADMESIIDSIDTANENISDGISFLRSGLDDMSQHLLLYMLDRRRQ